MQESQKTPEQILLEGLVNTFNKSSSPEDFVGRIKSALTEAIAVPAASEVSSKSSAIVFGSHDKPNIEVTFSDAQEKAFERCYNAMSKKFPMKNADVESLQGALNDKSFFEEIKDALKLIANWLGEKLGKEWYKEESQDIKVRKSFKEMAAIKPEVKTKSL